MSKAARARAVSAAKLQRQRAAERRRRALIAGIAAAVVIAVAAVAGWFVYRAQQPDTVAIPRNATATGVAVGATGPVIDVYVDFLCPHCKAFETEAGQTLAKLAADGKARIVYHPIAILDGLSTSRYSTRAAAASGCVADTAGPGAFTRFAAALFAAQPPENSAGLSDGVLSADAATAGAPGAATCIKDGTYTDWVTALTETASQAGVTTTPTVTVNGTVLPNPTADTIQAAVNR